MPALELCLPNMVMRVDKSWRDDLCGAVNYLSRGRWGVNVWSDASNLVSLD